MNAGNQNRAFSKTIVKPSHASLMLMNIINASDILKQYAEQERNFQNLNLSRVDLNGANLQGIDFS